MVGLWLDDNKHVGGFLCFDWIISATLAGRVTFLLEWGKTRESRQGTCQRGCYRYLKTSRHKEKSVVWRARLFPQETTSAYQEKEKVRSVTNSVCQYHHIYTKDWLFCFISSFRKKKFTRFARFSPSKEKNKKNRSWTTNRSRFKTVSQVFSDISKSILKKCSDYEQSAAQ